MGGYGVGLPPGVSAESAYGTSGGKTEPLGVTSLLLGVVSLPLSLCCGLFTVLLAFVGLVLGIVSLTRVNARPELYSSRGVSIAGIVVNGLILLSLLVLVFVFGVLRSGLFKP